LTIFPKISEINLNYDLYNYFDITDISFYFYSPNTKIEFIAFDILHNFSYITELSNLIDYSNIKLKNFNSNKLLDLPFIIGSSAFNLKNSNWEPFKKHNWFIPRFLIIRDIEKTYLVTFHKEDDDKTELKTITNNFIQKLKSLKKVKNPKIKLSPNKITSFEEFSNYANSLKDFIKSEKLLKIVPAVENIYNFSAANTHLIELLKTNLLNTFIYAFKLNDSIFFGASPENFFTKKENQITIDSLASTAPYNSNYKEQLSSLKNYNEQKIVSDFIAEILQKYNNDVEIDNSQKFKIAGSLVHLKTIFKTKVESQEDTFKLLNELFPTPAVCGFPQKLSYELINKYEPFSRGLYSGVIGYISTKSIEMAVAIRCGLKNNNSLRLYGGAGFIKESDIENEYNEINSKISTITNLLKNE